MGIKRSIKPIIPIIAFLVAAWSCAPAIDAAIGAPTDDTLKNNARITLTLPSRIADSGDSTKARAVGHYIDQVILTAINDADEVVASVTSAVDPDRFNRKVGIDVPAGVQIRVKAEVFSLAMSATVPTVRGVSSAFTVQANENITIGVTCLPVDPVELNDTKKTISIGTDVINMNDGKRYLSPVDRWLKISSGTGTHTRICLETTTTPDVSRVKPTTSSLSLNYYVYDDSGIAVELADETYLGRAKNSTTGYEITFKTESEKTYYVLPVFQLMTSNASLRAPTETQCEAMVESLNYTEDAYEPNNQKNAAIEINANQTYMLTLLDEDWFKFTVAQYSTLSITCGNDVSNFAFSLSDSNGQIIFGSEDLSIEAGTYYLHVISQSSAPASYQLYCNLAPGPDDGFGNDTPKSAYDIKNLNASDKFTLGGTADWFTFTFDEPGWAKISPTFASPSYNDEYQVTLYDSSMNEISQTDSYPTTISPPQGVNEGLLAGTYYCKFEAIKGHPSYTLNKDLTSLDSYRQDSAEENDTSAQAATLNQTNSLGNPSRSSLFLADDDWFTFTPSQDRTLMMNFGVVAIMDPEVTVYDESLNELHTETLSQWAYIDYSFKAGTKYFVRVRPKWLPGEGNAENVLYYELSLY
jgi:hypothetical protein